MKKSNTGKKEQQKPWKLKKPGIRDRLNEEEKMKKIKVKHKRKKNLKKKNFHKE